MTTKLSCPVCDRSEITDSICPNCETDLSAIRLLAELPVIEAVKSESSFNINNQLLTLIVIFVTSLLLADLFFLRH
jgi:C4-type Zn-finger protein